MKKIETDQGWHATLAEVIEARSERYTDKEHKFDDLQKSEVVHEEKTEDEHFQILEFKAAALIPKPLRKVLPMDSLDWVQESRMNVHTYKHVWKMRAKHKPDLFRCEGATEYKEEVRDGKPYTYREIRGEVEIKLPMFGRLAEEAIYRGYLKNNENDHKAIQARLDKMRKNKDG